MNPNLVLESLSFFLAGVTRVILKILMPKVIIPRPWLCFYPSTAKGEVCQIVDMVPA